MWIGANDIVHEGRWVWVDGTSVSHSLYYWYPGEPNNDNNEDCAGLATGYGSKMNDYTCTWGGLEYICERKGTSVTQNTTENHVVLYAYKLINR